MTTAIAKRIRLKKEDFLWEVTDITTGQKKIAYQGDLLLELYSRGRAWEIWGDEIHLSPNLVFRLIKKEKKDVKEQK